MGRIFFVIVILLTADVHAQNKKPLDHTVYDNWQSIGERKISNNGRWIIYTIDVQEGDGTLVIQSSHMPYRETIPRGYDVTITEDSRYAVFKIKPTYTDIRQARIKKKTPDDSPKDSLAIVELGKGVVVKEARVKSYKIPEKNAQWVAWQIEKPVPDSSQKKGVPGPLAMKIDSLKKAVKEPTVEQAKKRRKVTNPPVIKNDNRTVVSDDPYFNGNDADEVPGVGPKKEEGTALIIYNLRDSVKQTVHFVSEYIWSKTGNILVTETTTAKKDSLRKPTVCIFRTTENRFDTIMKGGNDFRHYAIDEEGYRLAFVAERDSSAKALQQLYKLWYWQNGYDSALMIADKNIAGMPVGWNISENTNLHFSKSGKRLFVGTAPVQPPKDTTLIDIDLVKVDIWNYKDDYLQTMQLKNMDRELKKSYPAMVDLNTKSFVQLGDKEMPDVLLGKEGDADFFVGITDAGKRIAMQWEGRTLKDIYVIDPKSGSRKLIKENLSGYVSASPDGKYVLWYDAKVRQYFTWRNNKIKNISSGVKTKLYDEDFDMPTEPSSYGIMGWTQSDLAVLVYDKFDIWQLDPDAVVPPVNITAGEGRKNKITYRYIRTNPDEKFISPAQEILLHMFSENNKHAGLATCKMLSTAQPRTVVHGAFAINNRLAKAEDSNTYIYTKESYVNSPDLYVNTDWQKETKLSAINARQADYNWGTAELFQWKAYNGKQATGIVYKPGDFDPKKKYPVICYFYEKLSDGLYQYIPPAPTPSRLNISFFVSRGYIVFVPDISYTTGHPGKSAYNYIVSGARALVKKGWADSTRMGLQGQSWGGYQTAYVITQTQLFKAAWAGAPVSNMTSAYGGIRWATGMNRQFQYERTQSRIGATLWEKPQLYIENSPLFHLPKVRTPLVIMHNDNDGAVPWYQGIELFTGLRRLGKPVWLLNYNGEEHNLMERKNRKDIQIREQQFFDWLLKGQRPAQWLSEGVPATMKGKVWGLEDMQQ
ncbi:alpha/beta hydrolase family protein [Agriterribacter sp.]|uniref:alpha/beta hydrolase family protein n=1 Tax=Agriterribacter sp. TaxID=2821509 RepID=UPI002C10A06A|nr:prolyl oligopeptidase family serine peptidase [Agriterribacter sp.]HTN06214.1 prolyl oligopeptidase family serine peptidase [Agriterribacter sp.]